MEGQNSFAPADDMSEVDRALDIPDWDHARSTALIVSPIAQQRRRR
jgi:hypothetical protein